MQFTYGLCCELYGPGGLSGWRVAVTTLRPHVACLDENNCDVPPLGSTSLEVSARARGVGLSFMTSAVVRMWTPLPEIPPRHLLPSV
ncbi:hypothetical protein TNCV_4189041 [Trichonephila clavipes]|nr:hypothetical protein TNCV_4189041 [Trichonephila clavipes]